jgi:hypothetical protein
LIKPPNLRFNLSSVNNIETKDVHLELNGIDKQIEIEFTDFFNVDFDYSLEGNLLHVTCKLVSDNTGEFEGRLFITYDKIKHQIPIHIRISDAAVDIAERNGQLFFEIIKPSEWTYTKITAINKETLEKNIISFSPKDNHPLNIYQSGEYWIEVNINTKEKIFDVYETIEVNSLLENDKTLFSNLENIERPVLILFIIIVIIMIFCIRILRN